MEISCPPLLGFEHFIVQAFILQIQFYRILKILGVCYTWYPSVFRILRSWTRQAKYSNLWAKHVTSPSAIFYLLCSENCRA